MAAPNSYRVFFPEWYDEPCQYEVTLKGWLQGVEIHFADGQVESLFFYDPVRLAQDLDANSGQGRPYIAERGLIVVPEISREAILTVVAKLVEEDFFAIPNRPAPSRQAG